MLQSFAQLSKRGRIILVASVLALIGSALLRSRLGERIQLLSYDAAYLAIPKPREIEGKSLTNVVILKFSNVPPRTNIAACIDMLTTNNALFALVDFRFYDPKPEDPVLAEAIRTNGKVLLATELSEPLRISDGQVEGTTSGFKPLVPEFETNACDIASVNLFTNRDWGVRMDALRSEHCSSLPYKAAVKIGASLTSVGWSNIWLNLYGEPLPVKLYEGDLESILKQGDSVRSNIVFVGAKDETDVHPTAFSKWGGSDWDGVDLLACNFLNLWRGDFLLRMTSWKEYALVLLAALVLGVLTTISNRRLFVIVASVMFLGLPVVAVWSVWKTHVWFNWGVICFCQTPVAAAACVVFANVKPVRKGEIVIPAHTVHRFLDEGGFGEVWLATNDTLSKQKPVFRAVKVIHSHRVKHYQAELKAVISYEPISRRHDGLLQILQVGQDDVRGYFYYVMELADDEKRGRGVMVDDYSPRTLGKEVEANGTRSLEELIVLGISLADALGFLHRQGLVHRDIKPDNIVYVDGKPKLADPGLITTLDRSQISKPGTPWFMDKETHGTPLGDIYSLGRTLKAVAGDICDSIDPEPLDSSMPISGFATELGHPELRAYFNRIVNKACAEGEKRYQSARELCEELKELQNRLFKSSDA